MKIELEKYNIQMPAFGKIGGILANELSVDEAACEHCFSLCFLSRIPLGFLAQLPCKHKQLELTWTAKSLTAQ